MKLQYLGDARDSFKWDYQDFLANQLGVGTLNFVPMLTPDDASNHGSTDPRRFPSRPQVVNFCYDLKKHRSLEYLRRLPGITGSDYKVSIHRPDQHMHEMSRETYFGGIAFSQDALIFLDPDNGFEPKYYSEKHVRYSDIEQILDESNDGAAVSVFQYWRRRKFDKDFADIRSRIRSGFATAIYGRYVMFVTISRSQEVIDAVVGSNDRYMSDKRLATVR